MKKNEHQKETAFLRHCIRYDESPGRRALDDRIIQIQRDESSVRRAIWLMVLLAAVAVAGLGYSAIFLEDYPQRTAQFVTRFIVRVFFALGLGALISLVAFVGLRLVYRLKLDQRREECRQLVTKLLESRLGRPVTTPWRESRVADGYRATVQVAIGGNGSPAKTESTARG